MIPDTVMIEEGSEVDVVGIFSTEDVFNATKDSNFNKGLGPDCFDGSILNTHEGLRSKVVYEITEALNGGNIP